ncbi:hypothetical protein Tco_0374872 [Tanacetum coccineum]
MRRASKGYTGVDILLFPTMLVQGPILQGEGSTVSVESHHTPSGGHTPGSDKGSMTLHELTVLCTKLSNKVDSLEIELKQTKQTYCDALTKLIKKINKLEQTIKTRQARRRAKIVVSDDKEIFISRRPNPPPEDQLGVLSAAKGLADAAKKNVNTYTRRRRAVSIGDKGVSTTSRIFSSTDESVSTAGASMPVSTTGMVQQVNIFIPSSSETTETTKDKGKALMQESEQPKKIKKRVQIQMSLDEELAQKLHEEEQGRFNAEQEDLLASETTKDEANPPVTSIDWDDVQAQIQVDEHLAHKLLEEEKENLSIEERARLLVELIDKRKKLQAGQRYEAIRNKPQTMYQQRKTMCTYMKNMAGYKMEHFKGKRFYKVKEMFDNFYKQVTLFVPIDFVMEKERTKRAGLNLQEESSNRQKIGERSEPTKESKEVYQIFEDMLKNFDRDDLVRLWSLVHERFNSTEPTKDKERELWVELKGLFEPVDADELWKSQKYMHDPLTWRLYDKCGVHHVSSDRGHDIFMLVEKDYPLTRGLLTLMLCNKL